MKIIKIASCLSTDDEGRYFEECPYAVKHPYLAPCSSM